MPRQYRTQMSKQLGKLCYVSSMDIKARLKEGWFKKIGVGLFCLFGALVSVMMFYGAWQHGSLWYTLVGVMFAWFIPASVMNLRSFYEVDVLAVGDKGVGRYTFSRKGHLRKEELLHFSPSLRCDVHEGYVDPHSPVSKKGYKIEAAWSQGNKKCFSIAYLKDEEDVGYSTDKQALEEAVKSFQRFMFHARDGVKD